MFKNKSLISYHHRCSSPPRIWILSQICQKENRHKQIQHNSIISFVFKFSRYYSWVFWPWSSWCENLISQSLHMQTDKHINTCQNTANHFSPQQVSPWPHDPPPPSPNHHRERERERGRSRFVSWKQYTTTWTQLVIAPGLYSHAIHNESTNFWTTENLSQMLWTACYNDNNDPVLILDVAMLKSF